MHQKELLGCDLYIKILSNLPNKSHSSLSGWGMSPTIYTTKDGHNVRSRAEVIIDNLLDDLKIDHDYEVEFTINKVKVKPDWFLSKNEVIIEFWGMEDNRQYAKRQLDKLKLYAEHNIICLSLNDADLADHSALEQKIQNFTKKHQKTKGSFKPGVLFNIKTAVHRNSNDQQLTRPLDQQTMAEVRSGKRCYFCVKSKKPDRSKPLCHECWKQVQAKTMCSFCGKQFDEVIDDDDRYAVYVCDDCDEKFYEACKLCDDEVSSPVKGKPLCYMCYAAVSQSSPGMHTPKWLKKRRRRKYSDY